MRIALAQLDLQPDVDDNLAAMKTAITQAAAQQADLIVFPEASMKAFNTGRLDIVAETESARFVHEVATAAQESEIAVVAGMFRPADQVTREGTTRNRVFNTLLLTWPGENGPEVEFYDKVHLFDAYGFAESDTVAPGTSYVVRDIPLPPRGTAESPESEKATKQPESVTLGLATCFDIRFPEQFVALSQMGAEVIALPASWNDGEGKVRQWQTLVSARALDSTCFIAACGAARPGGAAAAGENEGPTGVGHSVLAAPDGATVATASYGPQLVIADIDVAEIERIRKSIPVVAIRQED